MLFGAHIDISRRTICRWMVIWQSLMARVNSRRFLILLMSSLSFKRCMIGEITVNEYAGSLNFDFDCP